MNSISFNDVDKYLPEASHADTVVQLKMQGNGYKGAGHIRAGLDTLETSVPEKSRFMYNHEGLSLHGMQGKLDQNEFGKYNLRNLKDDVDGGVISTQTQAEAEATMCLDPRNATQGELAGLGMVSPYCVSEEYKRLQANKKDGVGEAGATSAGMLRFDVLYKGGENKEEEQGENPYEQMEKQ